jgi:hypothetical protein
MLSEQEGAADELVIRKPTRSVWSGARIVLLAAEGLENVGAERVGMAVWVGSLARSLHPQWGCAP